MGLDNLFEGIGIAAIGIGAKVFIDSGVGEDFMHGCLGAGYGTIRACASLASASIIGGSLWAEYGGLEHALNNELNLRKFDKNVGKALAATVTAATGTYLAYALENQSSVGEFLRNIPYGLGLGIYGSIVFAKVAGVGATLYHGAKFIWKSIKAIGNKISKD